MKRLKLFFACLLMAVLSIGQVWAEDVTFTFASKSELQGWTATPAPSSCETASPARGLAWSKSAMTMTYTLDGYGVSHVKVVASTNQAGNYTLSVNGGTGQAVTKDNNKDYDFDVNVADGGTITIATAYTATGKSFWIKSIILTKSDGGDKPVVSFSPIGGKYATTQSVTLTSEGADHIYYTTNGDEPTTSSATYSSAISVSETTTIKAFAVKGEVTGDVASATYTFPYTTIEALLPNITSSETAHYIKMTNWIVTGVSGAQVFLTDGTEYGVLAYKSGHGFAAGNILNGVMDVKAKVYKDVPEMTDLTTSTTGLTRTTGGTPTVYEKDIDELSLNNHGIVVKLSNVTYNEEDGELSDGTNTIAVTNKLYSGLSLEDGKEYNITGVVGFTTTGTPVLQIYPRSEDDVEEVGAPVVVKTLKSIAIAGYSTVYEQGDVFSFDGTCTATYSVTQDDVPQPDENKVVTPTSVTSPNMSTLGSKEITVSYTEDEVTKNANYSITVVAPTVYKKVTSAPDDWSGEYLLVYETTVSEVATAYVWTGVEAANCYATTAISSSNIITKPAGAVKLTVTALTGDDEGKYSIMVNGGTNNGKYIYGTSGSNGVSFGTEEYPNTIELSSGAALITSNTSFMQYNSTSGQDRFRYYKSGTTTQNDVQLYRKAVSSEVTITNPTNGTVSVLNGEAAVSTGASITEGTVLTVSIADVTGYRFTLKAFKTGEESTFVPIDDEGKLTMPDYPITITADELALFAVGVAVNDNTMGSATINGGTATIYVDDDDIITLVATPASGHEFVNWTVSDDDIDLDDENAASTTALAGAAGTITANFQVQSCSSLAAPVLDAVTKTYNSATIAWLAVDNADGYVLNLTQGATPVVTDEIITEGVSYAAAGLAANTTYHYTVMAVGDGTAYCAENNPLLEGDFTTNDYPAATLSLVENGGEAYAWGTDLKMNDVIALPTALTGLGCSGKVLAGWSSVAVEETDTKPTSNYWDAGADYTLGEGAQTLYAVFGTQIGGGASNVTLDVKEYAEANEWANGEAYNATVDGISFTYGGGGNNGKYYTSDNSWRFYSGGSLAISGTGITGVSSTPSCDFTESAGTYTCDFTATVKITKIIVSVSTPVICEGYTTSCSPAKPQVATPVINGVTNNETYTTAQTITLTCETEGAAIYYSLDGADAVAYTDPFSVGTYGAHTLTAYATKTDYDDSDEASVSFTLNLPFASLEDLVAADLTSPTNVTVSFSNVVIKDIYYYPNNSSEDNRKGLVFDIQKGGQDIKIYYNAKVPTEWVAGGKVSGTLTDCPWKIYSGAWQLAPASGFAWGDLTYTAPKEVSSVVVSGEQTKKDYVDGEKFKPAGLTVTVNYTEGDPEVNPTGVTFACTPERVTKATTSVSVVATFGETSSAAVEVTNFTVGDIQLKTVAEFIEAGNADMRCYLEGTVSNYTNTTKGYFDLTDETGTIYIYGCDQPGEFAENDKIKVIAEDYEFYSSKDEAKNVVFVSKTPAATIDIDDINMTVGDELALSAIEATITPVEAEGATINYEVTEGTAVSISEGKIIADAEGEATITASIAAGTGYLAGSTTFTVSVAAAPTPVPENTDIITAEKIGVEGNSYVAWEDKTGFGTSSVYAGNSTNGTGANAGALQLRYNTATDKQSGIVLTSTNGLVLKGLSVTVKSGSNTLNVYAKNTAYNGYSDLYSSDEEVCGKLIGTVSATGAMTLEDGISYDDNYQYIGMRSANGALYLTDITITWGDAVTPTADYTRGVTIGNYGTICLPNGGNISGAKLFDLEYYDGGASTLYLLEVEGNAMVAGRPYIFLPSVATIEVFYTDDADADAGSFHGLIGWLGNENKLITPNAGNYILYQSQYWFVNSTAYVTPNHAYIHMEDVPTEPLTPAPGAAPRRRVAMAVNGENAATGFENIESGDAPMKVMIDGTMYILRGEKVYDATGRLVK